MYIFFIRYSLAAQLRANRAHAQLAWFNGSLANGAWKMQLSGASRTEPARTIVKCNNQYSGEFLTVATPGKQTVMRSDSAYLLAATITGLQLAFFYEGMQLYKRHPPLPGK
jgi:hypothetical protein